MKKVKNTFKLIAFLMLSYLFLAFITPFNKHLHKRSIENQINYLLDQKDMDIELQSRYPEGYIFFNALLALSIVEYYDQSINEKTQFSKDLDRLMDKLLSKSASNNFPTSQKLSNGAFYNGWVNFTLRKYLNSTLFETSHSKIRFRQAYDSLTNVIVQSQLDSLTILDTYPGSYWPGDNLICAASLPSHYSEIKSEWIQLLKTTSKSNLIHHDDMNLNKVRGSSQSLIIYLFGEIDMNLAIAENKKFEQAFKSSFMGIKFVKEDLKNPSFSDVDSGPVLFGFGSVATIMNIKTQKSLGARTRITEGFLNVLGMPINLGGKKFYLFKQEPMFDLFMLWVLV